jgi:ribonuclease HI
VLNQDLWKRLIPLLEKHKVQFVWTRGHSGTEENERCDVLAVAAAKEAYEEDVRDRVAD